MCSTSASLYSPGWDAQFPRVARSPSEIWGPRLIIGIVLIWASSLAIGFRGALALLTGMALLTALIGIKRPAIGLLGVGMLCALDTVTRGFIMSGGLLRWNTFNYFLLLVIVITLPCLLRLGGLQIRALQLLLIVVATGLLFSPSRITGVQDTLNLVAPLGILAYAVRADRRGVEVWQWLGLVTGTLGALGGLVYYLSRSGVPDFNHTAFAYFPTTPIFTICLAWPSASPRYRGPLLGLAVVNFCWVALSGSRGCLLVALCCAIFLVMQCSGVVRRFAIVGAATLACLLIMAQFPELQERTRYRVAKLGDSHRSFATRTSGRFNLMIGGTRLFLDHPLGVGTGGFQIEWAALEDREGLGTWKANRKMRAHSAWIKTLVENGILGFVLQVIYVYSFAAVAWRTNNPQIFLLGLMITVALAVAFLTTEFSAKGLWLFAVGGMVILHRETKQGSGGNSGSATTGVAWNG